MNFGLKGHFNIIKQKANGEIVEQYAFTNLILNSGLDLVGQYIAHGNLLYNCHVGSGNTEPNVTQTTLSNWLASRASDNSNIQSDTSGDVKSISFTHKYIFNAGVATGNISEIGIANGSSRTSTLFCRTLVKDSQGQPTVISKLPDEILEVYYTLKVIINHQDVIGVGKINNIDYNYIIRPANIGKNTNGTYLYDGEIGDITRNPQGQYVSSSTSSQTYENGQHRLKYVMQISPNTVLNNGIRSVLFSSILNSIGWQCQFSRVADGQPIIKTNQETVRLSFEVSWGRA